MQRYIALDIGLKRTGAALVDDEVRVATPLCVITYNTDSKQFIQELEALIDEWEPAALIIGLPIDLKGKEAIAAQNMRNIVDNLSKKLTLSRGSKPSIPIHLIDERLSTVHAEKSMKSAGVVSERRKEVRDALAAAYIAQTYIDTL